MVKVKKKKGMTIDNLAGLIQREFIDVKREFINSRKETNERFNKIEIKLEDNFNFLNGRLDLIEREIADIKKRLDNVVYRHELESLRTRVEKLEKILTAK